MLTINLLFYSYGKILIVAAKICRSISGLLMSDSSPIRGVQVEVIIYFCCTKASEKQTPDFHVCWEW